MMRGMKKAVTVLLAVAAVGLCGFNGALSPRDVGAAGKPDIIHVAIISDFSGPYAPVVGPTRPGAEDAWKYVNTKLGGVHGVKVVPIIRDMGGKIDIGQSMYNEVITLKPKPLFVDFCPAPLAVALRPRFVEDDIVGLQPSTPESLYPLGNSYGLYALYPEQTAIALKWIKDNWKEKRNPRIGIITWDTAFGKSILNEEFNAYLRKIGVDLVGTELFGIREVDLTVQLLRLKGKNPDYLVSSINANGAMAVCSG